MARVRVATAVVGLLAAVSGGIAVAAGGDGASTVEAAAPETVAATTSTTAATTTVQETTTVAPPATTTAPPTSTTTTTTTSTTVAPIVPPEIPTNTPEGRQLALTLPASDVVRDLHGEPVRVIAWAAGEIDRAFVFQRGDGTRGFVIGWPDYAYTYSVTDDPCVLDPFGVVEYDYAACS